MQERVLRRSPVIVPALETVGADLMSALARASAGLGELPPVSSDRIQEGAESAFEPLRHSLSGPYRALHGRPEIPLRSETEQDCLDWLDARTPRLGSEPPAGFADRLERLNRKLVGDRGGWRTGAIGTARDARGNTIRFPPLAAVRHQLEQLRRLLSPDPGGPPALFAATMALVLVTNGHPFKDGNGRVGRVLFNHVLRQSGMRADVYVPVYELAERSDGGYLIALRQGELRGQWQPLFEFVISMLGVYRALARADQAVAHVS